MEGRIITFSWKIHCLFGMWKSQNIPDCNKKYIFIFYLISISEFNFLHTTDFLSIAERKCWLRFLWLVGKKGPLGSIILLTLHPLFWLHSLFNLTEDLGKLAQNDLNQVLLRALFWLKWSCSVVSSSLQPHGL